MPSPALALLLSILPAAGPSILDDPNDWVYVLQLDGAASVEAISATTFDLAVIDPTEDGTEETEISPERIAQLRAGGRVVLAYLSIGEAETYRWYWDPTWNDEGPDDPDAPPWLGPVNPAFPDNRKVRYWMSGWQDLMFGTASGSDESSLDRILDQGFDGVYLDIVDAFDYWSGEVPELTREQARSHMIEFVEAMSAYGNTRRGTGFLFVPQNGESIVLDDQFDDVDALGLDWLAVVDGLGIESLFWNELSPQPQPEIDFRLSVIAAYRAAGAEVFVTDYVWDPPAGDGPTQVARVDDFATRTLEADLVPYTAVVDRGLDEILEIPSGGPFAVPQPRPGGIFLFLDGFETGNASRWSVSVP